MSTRLAVRLPVLAAGGVALLAGLYAALLLLGLPLPAPRAPLEQVHGPLLVLGFVGTLIALERAVALGARWALLAPGCSAAGGVALLLTGPSHPARLLLMLAAVLLLLVYRQLWRRQPGPALLAQGLGALAWYAAVLLWLAGAAVPETVPWLATFVVATIAGERLDLAQLALPPSGVRWFLAALGALTAGVTATALWPDTGAHLFGVGLLATVGWLVVHDVARRTVRGRGLPRYVAVGLLTGYAWLAVAGLLWAGAGPVTAGPRYDATLHATFLGFTMSMIFVHAPVILPAVLRRPLPYRPWLYVPLALLHGSLLVRLLVGDGLAVAPVWRWAGVANVLAVLAFLGCALAGALTTARPGHRPAAGPVPAVR
ncbi:hypothetical protein ONA70_32385 [Micromonospora yasonensis]|uniref:hypothetical protein n=1 Tax=Micromonospora yasonensis TaxID=1128667 RepID=UPI0022315889|nr:hypothetical protein [Micromonospora yasonensis]